MKILYSITAAAEPEKQPLYIKGNFRTDSEGLIHADKGEELDFTTYFNSFSLKKWKRYTTLTGLRLCLHLNGLFRIFYTLITGTGKEIHLEDTAQGEYVRDFGAEEMKGDILGFSISSIGPDGIYKGGEWQGKFDHWQEKHIGISITTFKRERYVKRTMETLQSFQKNHGWLHVLVVDNGSTLQEKDEERFRIIHNRNFGGSGGFTRGMMEYMDKGNVDYILLMDDDIVLELSSIERSHALLCGLKKEYQESFLSGAMLSLEKPIYQYENTAYWGKIRLHSFGKGMDLSEKDSLIRNEETLSNHNRYGAWWYCAIPLTRIRDIGYPLPVFVKGDDMEYGIRNHRELIHMNGIGVWHQSFASKMSPVIYYYSDRNMLIINHYAEGCGFLTFATAVFGRIVKRMLQGNRTGLYALYLAIQDYHGGFEKLTEIPSDEKMKILMEKLKKPAPAFIIGRLIKAALAAVVDYPSVHRKYIAFREKRLCDSGFWKSFMC